METNAFNAVFPVIVGRHMYVAKENRPLSKYDPRIGKKINIDEKLNQTVSITGALGTCFCLKDNIFVTAGHVLRAAITHDYYAIGFVDSERYKGVQIEEYEINDDIDIAVFKGNINGQAIFPISNEQHPMLFPVKTCGYPYALNQDIGTLSLRGFQGTIVSYTRNQQLAGKPGCYELSFTCPRGLSGSPLWDVTDKQKIAGVIIGTSNSEMIIHSERTVDSNGNESIYEKTEVMHLGIAVHIQEVSKVNFTMLDV